MLRCLTNEQFDDLIFGRLDDVVRAAAEDHLELCPDCRRRFLEWTAVPDADEWRRAALELLSPTPEEQQILDQFKQYAKSSESSEPWPNPGKCRETEAESLSDSVREVIVSSRPGHRLERTPEIPGFEILGELGRGGMGIVYKARQLAQDRVVALKMILAGREACAEDLGRFHDEAEAISRLRHPHIVQIYEVGEVEGRFYFVLEFVEGGTLAELIRGRPVPSRAAAQLLEALARAMHYAHQRGIVHRDLKPANVLLHGRKAFATIPQGIDHPNDEWDFRQYMPKITDFGLAKLLDRSESRGRTSSGDIVGTPSYMAPEQAQGQANRIGPATDVYALGAILYEMLTGRPPFLGATPMDTLFQVHTAEPVPPRQWNRSIPADLETICLKCLRKDIAGRYLTAEALADDLQRFLQGQSIHTQAMKRSPKSVWRRWGARALYILATILLAGLAGVAGFEWRRRANLVDPASAKVESLSSRAGETALVGVENEVRLRLRLAQADAEKGDLIGGIVQMIRVLDECEQANLPDLWRRLVNFNLRLWSERLPLPRSGFGLLVRDMTMDRVSGDLWILDERYHLHRIRPDGSRTLLKLSEVENVQHIRVAARGSFLLGYSPSGLRWWNLQTGSLLHRLPHINDVRHASLSPDGSNALIRADREGNVLWLLRRHPANESIRVEPLRVDRRATCWLWHPSGREILVGYEDGRLEVISIVANDSRRELKRLTSAIACLDWCQQGRIAVVGTVDGLIRFIPLLPEDSVIEWPPIRAHGPGPLYLAAGATDRVVSIGTDKRLRVWSGARSAMMADIPLAHAPRDLFLSFDGNHLACFDVARTASAWKMPLEHDDSLRFDVPVSEVTFASDFQRFAAITAGPRRQLLLGRLDREKRSATVEAPRIEEECLVCRFQAKTNDLLTVVRHDGVCRLQRRDPQGGSIGSSVPIGDVSIVGLDETANGERAIVWSSDGRVFRWDLRTNSVEAAKLPGLTVIRRAAMSPDGQKFVTMTPTGTQVWRWSEQPHKLAESSNTFLTARWHADGIRLRLGDSTYRLFDTEPPTPPSKGDAPAELQVVPVESEVAVLWTANRGLTWQRGAQAEPMALHPTAEFRALQSDPQYPWVLSVWSDGIRLIDRHSGSVIGPLLELPELRGAEWNATASEIIGWSPHAIRIWRLPAINMASAESWRDELKTQWRIDVSRNGSWKLLEGAAREDR